MDIETNRSTTHLSSENERKMDILGFMFRFLQFTFLGPSEETRDITWKRRLYTLVQFIMFFSYVPTFLGITLGLYKFRHDVADITDILVTGSSFVIIFIAALYITINWDDIRYFMVLIETKSGITHSFVSSNGNLLEIIEETRRKCKFLTKVISVVEFAGLCTFFLKPFILDFLEDPDNILTKDEYIKKQWKKMIYVIWLPLDPSNPKIFYSIYVYQVFNSLIFFCHSAPVFNFKFVLLSYAALQFKLVNKSMSDIDCLTSCSKLKHQNDAEEDEYEKVILSGMSIESHLSDLSDICVNQEVLVFEERESNEIYNFIRECIKLHQSAIRFTTKMNDLLSPVYTTYLIMPALPLIVSAFQLAMGGGLEKNIPYVCVSLIVISNMFVLCWFGQRLIDESLAVEQSAYNLLWYKQSIRVQKLISFLIMRSQKSVQVKRTGFPNVSIETFAMIMNVSYQWFTVLLNMLQE